MTEYNPIVPIGVNGSGEVSINLKNTGNISAGTSGTKQVTMNVSHDTVAITAGIQNSGIVGIGVSGGGGQLSNDYRTLDNKPKLNGVTLVDDKSFDDIALHTITTQELLNILR